MDRTKIICTIGPASSSKAMLRKMIKAGMDCVRLNFSHGTYPEHAEIIKIVRREAKQLGVPVAVMADLQGPRVRTSNLPLAGQTVKKGDPVVLRTGVEETPDGIIPVGYGKLHREVKPGDTILIDEGLIKLKVLSISGRNITCKVVVGGIVTSYRGMNFPNSKLSVSSITTKDKKDLAFALKQEVDWVALSFVRCPEDVAYLRRLIKSREKKLHVKKPTKIIAKIEKREAVTDFDKILEVTDGVMVARGDLGIEMPTAQVPITQKMIIEKCLVAAKPVITATQMLLSMVSNSRPTRAEASDVANAVIDHTDAVMLSQETAVGKYPVETVKTMSKIISDTEESPYDDLILNNHLNQKTAPIDSAISYAAGRLARDVEARAILVATISGYSARLVSRYRPELPIVVAAENEKVRRQLALSWGVIPFVVARCQNVDELIKKVVACAKHHQIIKEGDKVIIIGGQPVGKTGNVNLVKVHQV
ncbi:MAG: pyruvate kinase [Parcubacteria group bacterium]|nr:pyruvate kinase [Parcubacteria group bacterium]